jgi:hypothetical protein
VTPVRVLGGSSGATFTDSAGNVWYGYGTFSPGVSTSDASAVTDVNTASTINGSVLPAAGDQRLYNGETHSGGASGSAPAGIPPGNSMFLDLGSVPTGRYQVTIKEAEITFAANCLRVFDVAAGTTSSVVYYASQRDLFREVGALTARDIVFVVDHAGGTFRLQFDDFINQAKFASVEVAHTSTLPATTPLMTERLHATTNSITSTAGTFTVSTGTNVNDGCDDGDQASSSSSAHDVIPNNAYAADQAVWTFSTLYNPRHVRTSITGAVAHFKYRVGAGVGGTYVDDQLALEISVDNGANWQTIATVCGTAAPGSGCSDTVPLSATTLTDKSYNVSAWVTNATEADNALLRIRGINPVVNGTIDRFRVLVDSAWIELTGS